jgi:hypothetical protein
MAETISCGLSFGAWNMVVNVRGVIVIIACHHGFLGLELCDEFLKLNLAQLAGMLPGDP